MKYYYLAKLSIAIGAIAAIYGILRIVIDIGPNGENTIDVVIAMAVAVGSNMLTHYFNGKWEKTK